MKIYLKIDFNKFIILIKKINYKYLHILLVKEDLIFNYTKILFFINN